MGIKWRAAKMKVLVYVVSLAFFIVSMIYYTLDSVSSNLLLSQAKALFLSFIIGFLIVRDLVQEASND